MIRPSKVKEASSASGPFILGIIFSLLIYFLLDVISGGQNIRVPNDTFTNAAAMCETHDGLNSVYVDSDHVFINCVDKQEIMVEK